MNIRRIQYAPFAMIMNPPHVIVKQGFVIGYGNIELETTLDKLVSNSVFNYFSYIACPQIERTNEIFVFRRCGTRWYGEVCVTIRS